MRRLGQRHRRLDNRAQATTELAIMGSIVLMGLLFLAQQGFIYNAREGLEMYTFRQALQMSKASTRGISLTTVRDVVSPSFFTGLKRQRIMASTSVEANPFDLWVAQAPPNKENKNTPQDIGTYQLMQIGEGMIQNGYFIKVPVTKVQINTAATATTAASNDGSYINSSISELDAQTPVSPTYQPSRTSTYDSQTASSEGATKKTFNKGLETRDEIPMPVKFETADKIKEDYLKNDWEKKILGVIVDESTIPKDIVLTLKEIIARSKQVTTPH